MLKVVAGVGLLVLVTGFWYFNVATGGTELAAAGDTLLYYAPQYAAVGAAWREGQLPLWNAYQLCGHPWLATLQGGVLYPGHLLYVLLPTHTGMAVSSLVHLMIVAAGIAWLARRLELAGWAALVAGCLYSTNGPLPLQASVPNLLEAGAWLTPGAVAVHGIVRSRNPGWVGLLAFSLAASLLAGYPQFSVYACYTWGALLVILLANERSSPRDWLAPCGWFALAIGTGALLASPQLLASFELTAESTRSLGDQGFEAMFPLGWPKHSIRHSIVWLVETASDRSFAPFGLAAPLLAVLAVLHPNRRLVLSLFSLLLVVFGIAIGPASPLFDLYLLLPGVESFRMPTRRLLFVAGFLVALLAGFGVDQLLRLARERVGVRAAHALGGALLAAVIAEPFLDDTPRAELPYAEPEYADSFPLEQELLERIAGEDRVLFWNPGVRPPLPSKLGAVFGVRVFDDYEPMSLRRQDAYFSYLASGRVDTSKRAPFFGRLYFPESIAAAREMATRRRLLDIASVRYLIGANSQRTNQILHIFAQEAGFVRQPRNKKVWEVSPVVYRNEKALPRAYVTYRAKKAPPAEALLAQLAARSFDPLRVSYVEGPPVGAGTKKLPRGHPVKIERDDPTRIEIWADLATEGLVVLSDSYYPGWEVTVDGEPRELLATNWLFRGVAVPAGAHRVVFSYRPWWLLVSGGAALAGLTVLVALVAFGASARMRRV